MKMTFRWYGRESDPIPLKYVKQIPGMSGLMGLLDKPAGVDWPEEEVKALVEEVHAAGLELEVVESVNVHEDIKMGLPTRDEYIANYISTIRTLAKYGVKVIIYNFMPVFDWLRTDLARVIPEDGSISLYFDEKDMGEIGPMEIVRRTAIRRPPSGIKPEKLPDTGFEPLARSSHISPVTSIRHIIQMLFIQSDTNFSITPIGSILHALHFL